MTDQPLPITPMVSENDRFEVGGEDLLAPIPGASDAHGDSDSAGADEKKVHDTLAGPENRRHREPLREFLRAMIDARPGALPNRVEVCCSADGGATESFFRDQCVSRLPRIVPRGLRVDLVRLCQRAGGERLHNRYILTDLGGVTFGVGLDEGDAADSDDVQLLDRAQYEERWRQYADEAPAFDRPEPSITIEGVA